MSLALESLVPDPSAPEGPRGVAREVLAFGLVGGSGAVAFVLLSMLFVQAHLGLPAWVVSTLCYAVLIGPVYLLHRRFTFSTDASHARALPRYAGVQMMSLLLASVFSYLAYGRFGLTTPWAPVLVTGLASGVSFLVLKFWAFARPKPARVPAPNFAVAADELAR